MKIRELLFKRYTGEEVSISTQKPKAITGFIGKYVSEVKFCPNEKFVKLVNLFKNKAVSGVRFKDGIKTNANFEQSSLVILDFDNINPALMITLQQACQRATGLGLFGLMGTTKSHQLLKQGMKADRFRLFIFTPRILSFELYQGLLKQLYIKFPEADPCPVSQIFQPVVKIGCFGNFGGGFGGIEKLMIPVTPRVRSETVLPELRSTLLLSRRSYSLISTGFLPGETFREWLPLISDLKASGHDIASAREITEYCFRDRDEASKARLSSFEGTFEAAVVLPAIVNKKLELTRSFFSRKYRRILPVGWQPGEMDTIDFDEAAQFLNVDEYTPTGLTAQGRLGGSGALTGESESDQHEREEMDARALKLGR